MSTDLRDGNQALFEQMNGEKKMRMFSRPCANTPGETWAIQAVPAPALR